MQPITFEWDDRKNRANQTKHGVSFEEARSSFFDDNGRIIPDPEHSETEDRFILLGMSQHLRILTVSHCYRSRDEVIRIISARRATKHEKLQYEVLL